MEKTKTIKVNDDITLEIGSFQSGKRFIGIQGFISSPDLKDIVDNADKNNLSCYISMFNRLMITERDN